MEDWNEKLLTAADTGDIEALKLSLQNDANIDFQGGIGRTALMFAARGGHLEICRLLIDTRCKIDTTDVGGWTALMMAASRGHLEICRLLIDTGCKIDTTDINGYTALHWGAQRGYLQTTRCLVEQGGASPLVTTRRGQTPYDLAAEWKRGQYKEVMEYLQTVMSEKSSGVTAGQGIKDDIVPTEIKLMADKRSVPLYLELLESGSEKKRDIRLVIVGKNGAGKTSLIKRLFSEENTDVTSTNGIEIHTIKCKAMSDDGIWNKLDGTDEETEIHARLLKQYKETIEASVEEGIHKATCIRENTPLTSFEESKESEKVTQQPKVMTPSVTTNSLVEHPVTSQQRSLSLEQAKHDIESMLKSNVDLHDKEEYATLLLWDFAGDEEFYHTHQTFLSPDAIYLVVTKLNEADDKSAQEMFQLWMNSIHCYCRPKSNDEEVHRKENDNYIYPPVVLVGSHKDKVELTEGEEIEDRCRACLDRYVQDVSEDARRHLSKEYEYLISNTEDNSCVFKKIRQNLLNLAKTMKTWNMDYPLKFIQLEKRLQQRKKKLPIIEFRELKDISTETQKPLTHKELKFFLEFHHEMRTLVYFEDLSDYIILDTQWLSNAFKCIITAKKFQSDASRHLVKDKWDDLNVRGLLHSVVLENILDRNKKIFEFEEEEHPNDKHKDHILKVMEKFDIIIRPKTSDQVAADEKPLYYVPCMVKAVPGKDIYEMFNVTKDTCRISTWLCFQFSFLPPHLMNHLIASLSRNYEVAEVGVTRQEQSKIALFKNIAVFELQKNTKLTKLLVMTFRNIIQIQVWDFVAEIKAGQFKFIADFMTQEINKIIHTRFKMSTVEFSKKWDCGFKKPECMTESRNFDIVGKYYCTTCLEPHTFTDEWSDQPKPPKSLEAASGLKSDIEDTSHTNIIPENPPKSCEADIKGISQTNIIPENPPKSLEVATGLTSDKGDTTQTSIIRENEQKCDHKGTIKDNYNYIVQHILDVSEILDRMMTHLVISVDDRRVIENDKRQDGRTKKLLNIVIGRGGTTNNVFIDVLKDCGYNEIADNLIKESENDCQSSKLDLEEVPAYKIRLQKNYFEIINTLKHNDQ
ncbi:uncharacterized protein LOC127731935 isoform X4 [Mytilus californianus]|uniref:uncharacterized protein LOC127731935 isoform X4 n=1 Tax=Mytilus californianus TaxID=6549 RepID=UPI0022461C59|nr:uncharacterized protein LOC127731935 isoform X4 [Mytilus californianus]